MSGLESNEEITVDSLVEITQDYTQTLDQEGKNEFLEILRGGGESSKEAMNPVLEYAELSREDIGVGVLCDAIIVFRHLFEIKEK